MTLFKRKVYETRQEKRRDFIGGVVIMVVMNFIMYVVYFIIAFNMYHQLGSQWTQTFPNIPLLMSAIPWIVNIAFLIGFGLTRYWVALGGLAALASLMIGVLLFDVFMNANCFMYFNPYDTGY